MGREYKPNGQNPIGPIVAPRGVLAPSMASRLGPGLLAARPALNPPYSYGIVGDSRERRSRPAPSPRRSAGGLVASLLRAACRPLCRGPRASTPPRSPESRGGGGEVGAAGALRPLIDAGVGPVGREDLAARGPAPAGRSSGGRRAGGRHRGGAPSHRSPWASRAARAGGVSSDQPWCCLWYERAARVPHQPTGVLLPARKIALSSSRIRAGVVGDYPQALALSR
jgi:hypothetical protein